MAEAIVYNSRTAGYQSEIHPIVGIGSSTLSSNWFMPPLKLAPTRNKELAGTHEQGAEKLRFASLCRRLKPTQFKETNGFYADLKVSTTQVSTTRTST